ncbi:MAG: NAD(P)H-binding protein [Solirubrobacteraceae bacterium]
MILITTAGKVGSEAARLLAQRGVPVRVLARDPEKATALTQAGVDVAEGDLEAPTTIDAAMQDVTTVVLVSPAVPAQELSVIDGAARAGVGHVVKITSKASTDSPIARQRGQAETEARLIASGLGYTLLRSNFHMQNFLMFAPTIARTNSFGSSAGAGQVGLIDARDVGAVAAGSLLHPPPTLEKHTCSPGRVGSPKATRPGCLRTCRRSSVARRAP